MIRVLIAEDSKVIAMLLQSILGADARFDVVGVAQNGIEAVEMANEYSPDVITMDIHMPEKDGLEATKEIMSTCPTPIIVVSSLVNDAELNTTFNAMEAGALDVIEKPGSTGDSDIASFTERLTRGIAALSEVKVVKRRSHLKPGEGKSAKRAAKVAVKSDFDVLALVASTGGTSALQEILTDLPEDFPLSVLVVQHMTNGFTPGFISWLNDAVPMEVKAAENNQILQPGVVYVGPDYYHLGIRHNRDSLAIELTEPADGELFIPSGNKLLSSVAKALPGRSIGGLLTGMGSDGASGLLAMHQSNCKTFVQDEATSVVYGMPRAAKELGAADDEVALKNIPDHILSILHKQRS